MGSTDTTIALLHELRALGVALSIDDFGTGFSSLSYLKRLPIGRLKIDRSFVSGLPSHESDVAITGAIIGMARSLRLQVIAEGVETEEQAAFLAAHGCLKMQGYLLGRPMKPSDIGTDIFKTVAPI